ncbi:hypothetical protein [Tenacibaculum ovolyticum]|uniref:hypothetical protein n=1 Tax=Tenacibaculum ovolyticum TaxID=104270 RepID=UPI001F2A50C8|nr:hypothetical protein [Tenacibaculum ovolyticum]
MLKGLYLGVFLLVISTFYSCGIATKVAKKSLVEYLELHHKGKYEIVVFKRNFNTTNVNFNLFLVALRLVEIKTVSIVFEWDAKLKKLHRPYYKEGNSRAYLTSKNIKEIS